MTMKEDENGQVNAVVVVLVVDFTSFCYESFLRGRQNTEEIRTDNSHRKAIRGKISLLYGVRLLSVRIHHSRRCLLLQLLIQ